MKKEQIEFGDWKRLLFGQAPSMFVVEALLRTLVIFLVLLVVLRFMGKRMNGQLSVTEMAVMLTLGAIVAAGVQMPNQGVLEAVVVLLIILGLHRGVTWLDGKSPAVERVTQGVGSAVVTDGVLQLSALEEARISREQLFAMLRSRKVQSLARVDRAYLEACGVFSVFQNQSKKPGLSVLPPDDIEARAAQKAQGSAARACSRCGFTMEPVAEGTPCPHCQNRKWEDAVVQA